ncbi:MAG: hypothetical protein R3F02_15105 [Thiolinea sp.]
MTVATPIAEQTGFMSIYQSEFRGVLRWHQLDELWQQIRGSKSAWYVYAVGELPPETAATTTQLDTFITEIDALLRRDHAEDYCGIVYANNIEQPTMVKIFDPNNLGSSCGSSGRITLPGWILSTQKPEDLPAAMPAPNNRRRWWQKLFHTGG